jgi:hypothetical protein
MSLLQLFANHPVRMEVTAFLLMFVSAHKNSEVLSVNMVSIYCDILGFLGNMTYTPVAFP